MSRGSIPDQPQYGCEAMRHAAMRTLTHLNLSSGWTRLFIGEGEQHPGDDPIVADEEAHRVFSEALMEHPAADLLQIRAVVGEEDLRKVPVPAGQRLVVLDPLDGSKQWAIMRAGYCVASLMLLADRHGILHVESAVIATPTHTFSLVANRQLEFGPTYAKADERVTLLSCLQESEVEEPSFAFTGYKPKDRGSALALIKQLPRWNFLTLGGNPVTPYVVAGSLTAAVTMRSQNTWDAIGILMCSQTDAVVGDIDGTVVSGPAFWERFGRVDLTGNTRPIPAMIVAKDQNRFDEMATAVERARTEFGPNWGQGLEDFHPPEDR